MLLCYPVQEQDAQRVATSFKSKGLTIFAIPPHQNTLAFVNDPATDVHDPKYVISVWFQS
jgi:uncharacterized protein (DUF302 family)